MARSRKKTQKKARKSRKQRGGQPNQLTWELDRGDRVYQNGKKYRDHSVFWTDEPIIIPEKEGATYIGEYWLDYTDSPIMQGRGRLVYDKENPANGMHTIYDGYWHENKKNGSMLIEYMNGDNADVEFENDVLVAPNKWQFPPTYNYADGKVYEGQLVIKNGKAVPLDYDEVKPRTVFNFAPGPTEFLDSNGDYIQLDKREAERGFRMSQDPDFRPPAPPNSPQKEPVVVRRGPGIRGRLSGIRDSRLTSVEDRPLDRGEELRQMRELAASQTGLKPLRGLERGAALPAITTRKGGKYRKHRKSNKSGKKTRKNRTKK